MHKVYILYEERETSELCGVRGVWISRDNAVLQMKDLIEGNELYSDYSIIDFEKGFSQSDPMYNEDLYSNYYIKEMEEK